MSEICFDCLNKIYGGTKKPNQYIISDDYDLCEECGNITKVVVAEKKSYYLYHIRYIIMLFYLLYRILMIPYSVFSTICKSNKNKNIHK